MGTTGPVRGLLKGLLRAALALAAAGLLLSCETDREAPGRSGAPETPAPPTPAELDAAARGFSLPAPGAGDLGPAIDVWGTQYFTVTYMRAAGGVDILDTDNDRIGGPLAPRDWCRLALEGAGFVQEGEAARLYNFVDANGPRQTDCTAFLGGLSEGTLRATEKARFTERDAAAAPYGCGFTGAALSPYRTIAVDPSVIPFGSVLYAPAARGASFTDDGRRKVHDGYFYAGDRGGAIVGGHIDVFSGGEEAPQLPDLITHEAGSTTPAHIVSPDNPAAQAIVRMHPNRCS
ncbi:MAG: hypothetical protein KAH44_11370 [Oricola sp.]|jgi:3D (Asp-Asp-Asp) domain-containing protein|nr:hypothetical protein [Oricola sp.]